MNLENGTKSCTLEDHRYGILCVSFSPDGKHILTGDQYNIVRLWDAESGKCLTSLTTCGLIKTFGDA